jgi:SSS family transporter
MSAIDWIVVVLYLAGMIGLAVYLSRGQKSEKDYYLGGNDIGFFPIAISTMATQCSTNSILGAPAFVAFSVGGGLLWLQYEIAVPLSMIAIMAFMLPFYRKLGLVSVYGYLEERFGVKTRILLSVLFQFLRAFATGVTIYGISIVIAYCMGVPFWTAVIILGVFTIIYDSIGGMKGVIYSDVIQMGILYISIIFVIYFAIDSVGSLEAIFDLAPHDRLKAIDFAGHGLGDGKDFAFWPMLIGGFFLYASYYGCDQTQVQRELSTKSVDDTNWSLYINGVLRFPLVLTYSFLGICIAAYAIKNEAFIYSLPTTDNGTPNYNMSVPMFVFKEFPVGMVGIFMVGLFSAAMSSLDSTINSLSATSVEDIIKKFKTIDAKSELFYSKLLTIFWGTLCTIFAFFVEDISDSIIVSINKITSLINGPILGVFLLGILTKKGNELGSISGFILGFLTNLMLWIFAPKVSWLWWNAFGFGTTFIMGYLLSVGKEHGKDLTHLTWRKGIGSDLGMEVNWKKYYFILTGYCAMIVLVLSMI